jgi:hypothetical protein
MARGARVVEISIYLLVAPLGVGDIIRRRECDEW